jgi:alkylated DNA repair dioxygenase AlkB
MAAMAATAFHDIQADLFDPPLMPGLSYRPDVLTPGEERALTAELGTLALAPFRFHGWLGKRETISFGWRYDFGDASFAPAAPIPDFLLPLRASLAGFAGLPPDALAQALVVRYDPGAGIGWHRDRPVFEHVVAASLGASAELRLRRRTAGGFERATLPLAPRSAYHLAGEARHYWEHSILPMTERRWSISFRSLAKSGARGNRS